MTAERTLTDHEQELIAIAAAVSSGCRPCLAFHIKAARASGVPDEEMRGAVRLALEVRRFATDAMAKLADKVLGEAPAGDSSSPSRDGAIGELVSAAAALAANCSSALESHVSAATQLGATEGQKRTAFDIARAVKGMASKKVEDAAAKLVPVGTLSRLSPSDCSFRRREAYARQLLRPPQRMRPSQRHPGRSLTHLQGVSADGADR
jgi:AhpD family alkylhydroperoxidase